MDLIFAKWYLLFILNCTGSNFLFLSFSSENASQGILIITEFIYLIPPLKLNLKCFIWKNHIIYFSLLLRFRLVSQFGHNEKVIFFCRKMYFVNNFVYTCYISFLILRILFVRAENIYTVSYKTDNQKK